MKRHILLIGLPGAGKTTVGRLVAERLGSAFIDPDNMIVRRMQMPIARIFGEFGEPRFRQLEQEVMSSALTGPASVIAPGSGWAVQPGALEGARTSCFIIYMRTLAMTAAKRAGGDGTRPLLAGEDPSEKIRQLLKERESFFLQADAEVKADIKTAPQVAEEVATLAKAHAGW